ncbi:uncharacterized protein G2W53_008755 [Senna tora]|uniref:Uncharacterized protein n=1 Tax=Senna tora TaxID=362788 RepID=A0A835C971_9FABA|nr:uncharacterized protein G2W53_008755 [Senna tora]
MNDQESVSKALEMSSFIIIHPFLALEVCIECIVSWAVIKRSEATFYCAPVCLVEDGMKSILPRSFRGVKRVNYFFYFQRGRFLEKVLMSCRVEGEGINIYETLRGCSRVVLPDLGFESILLVGPFPVAAVGGMCFDRG